MRKVYCDHCKCEWKTTIHDGENQYFIEPNYNNKICPRCKGILKIKEEMKNGKKAETKDTKETES